MSGRRPTGSTAALGKQRRDPAHHQRSAALYAEIAEIDRGHHHEALFMAEREHQRAKEIKTEMSSQQPTGET